MVCPKKIQLQVPAPNLQVSVKNDYVESLDIVLAEIDRVMNKSQTFVANYLHKKIG